MPTAPADAIVDLQHLKMHFPIYKGLLRRQIGEVKAVDGLDLQIKKFETLGLVGESGCGKTTTGRCLLRLYRPTAGQIYFIGVDISSLPEKRIRPLRRQMGAIFQDPYGSLNPRETARSIAGLPMRIHDLAAGSELTDKVAELFRLVGLDPAMMDRVPHEFSGGQRQRLGIARALERKRNRIVLKGEVPSPVNPPPGCHFHPRCDLAAADCRHIIPPLRSLADGHAVACHRA